MTIGQRIAECRRQLGLSQESLGEKMGVSRQAISKWEADAALPEIDKLIALSKLFGVSVGWLLGVEELPQPEQAPLTEEQLNAMEQLIKLYASPAPQEPEKKSKMLLALSVLALVLAAATLLTCLTYHNTLSNSLGSLSYQMMNLQSGYDSVRAQINDLQTAETAPGTPDTLHWFEFQLTPDLEEPRVTVQMTAIPKRHANETAYFSVRKEGQEVANTECAWDGTAYVAQQELPLENGYEYWLIITDLQWNQEQIPLQDAHAQNLRNSFHLAFEVKELGHLTYQSGELVLHDFHFSLYRPDYLEDGALTHWNRVEVLLVRSGETIARKALVSEEDDIEHRQSFGYEFSHYELSFPEVELHDRDGLEIWVKATLSNGMECLEMVSSWGYEDGIFFGGELAQRVTQD